MTMISGFDFYVPRCILNLFHGKIHETPLSLICVLAFTIRRLARMLNRSITLQRALVEGCYPPLNDLCISNTMQYDYKESVSREFKVILLSTRVELWLNQVKVN